MVLHENLKIIVSDPAPGESLLDFTQTNRYEQLWSSVEEGSEQPVSLWKPTIVEGFYLLGDTVVTGSGMPPRSALLVRSTRYFLSRQ